MLCKQTFKSLRDLLLHFKFHFLCKEFVTFPFENCDKTYKLYVSMKAHISRFHKQTKLKLDLQDFKKSEPTNRITIKNVTIENKDMELSTENLKMVIRR